MKPTAPARRSSEDTIVNSAMSFAGASQRTLRLRRLAPEPVSRLALTVLVVPVVLALWWALVATWYLLLFLPLFLIAFPYRLLRRGARKRKIEARRHREVMAALERSPDS